MPASFAKLRWISLHFDLFVFICWMLSSGIIACPGSWSSRGSGTIVRPRAVKSDARRRATQQPLTPVPALATASAETKSSRNMEIPFISRLLGSKESRCTGSGSEGSYLFLSLGIRRRTYSSGDMGSCWSVTYVRRHGYLLYQNLSYNRTNIMLGDCCLFARANLDSSSSQCWVGWKGTSNIHSI